MSLRLNDVTLAGNIATDITLKMVGQDKQVATFNLAVDNPHKEATYFLPCEVWGKTAGNLNKYCRKGSAIYLEGCIVVESYEKDGQKRTYTKISCDRIQFLDSKQKSEERAGSAPFPNTFQGHPNTPEPDAGYYPPPEHDQGHAFDPRNPYRWDNMQDDDIPF